MSEDKPGDGRLSSTSRAALGRLGQALRPGRIPFVQQLSATECGAACLAMILGYHGKHLGVAEVREIIGVGRDGSNAKTIVEAACYYGLRARGVTLEMDSVCLLPAATILHWGFQHFVVFERLRRDSVDIVDPELGRRRVPLEEFRRQFTGVALLFEPSERFEGGFKRGPRVWRYLRRALAYTGHMPRILVASLLIQIFALAVPVLTNVLVDRVVPQNDHHLLVVLMSGLGALVVFSFATWLIRGHLLLHLRTLLDARLTRDFLDHLVSLPYGFFQRRSTGDLMARVNSNSTIREIFTAGMLSGLLDGALAILYLLLIVWASPRMALVVLVIGAVQVAVVAFARRRQRELMAQTLSVQARAEGYLVELLSGMETIKIMGSEQRAVEHWNDLFIDVLNAALARGRLNVVVDALGSALRLAAPLCVLGYGAVLVLQGALTLGAMLGLSALAGGFFAPLGSLTITLGQLQLLGSFIERINDVMETPPEQDIALVRPAPVLQGRIEVEHLSFRYAPLSPLVIKDVRVTVEPHEFVAIVGRSGSGKSTLASLLVGLYTQSDGRILYDGLDITHLNRASLRRQITLVPQNPYLFGSSIRANIALAEPSMPLDRIMNAAHAACVHDEIMAMPLGYDTPLLDRGASLSGGQRQRIALARALAVRPVVLVLDEAMSALDAISESRVQESLTALHCTRVVVAHRLSTVVHADRILVMDDGQIVEQGTHSELLHRGGIYAQLVATQVDSPRPHVSG